MGLLFDVPEEKKLRVVIDTDAACEADDPFAIAHALMSPKLVVKGILAEQFGYPESTKKSYEEIQTLLDAMGLSVPTFLGEEGDLKTTKNLSPSPAVRFLIEEAGKEEKKLTVLCLGAATNVARAMRECPEIIDKLHVIFIGGQGLTSAKSTFHEFNSGNDIEAANLLIGSGVKLWVLPSPVYGHIHIGLAEIQRRIYPCGKVGKHLFENMIAYSKTKNAHWTPGESWTLGDSPAVAVALNENCGTFVEVEAPEFNEDTTWRFLSGRPIIRVYEYVDPRYVLEDFISKLTLLYGSKDTI